MAQRGRGVKGFARAIWRCCVFTPTTLHVTCHFICHVKGPLSMTDTWQAGAARHSFSKLVDAAVDGHPQFVRRRDGREVVVVSKEYYERTKPGLKSVLLSH